ncbi:caspase family protein [Desulfatibacillum aliphaticivorans]|uniref:caspase family protein n=1 Tax=Desulfatibacillum aliphaticivorans TaxID=218208 RepID=UPI0009FB9936|nr:caspase family protein [Desulfatibacillum aliphaticivorans]
MRVATSLKTTGFVLVLCIVCLLAGVRVSAEMDWTELEPDAEAAYQKEFREKTTHLDGLIEKGEYVAAVEYVFGEAAPMPKEYRKKAVDNAVDEIRRRYDSGERAEAALEIMDLAIRFSDVKVLKRARNRLFASLAEDWRQDAKSGAESVQLPEQANGAMCVLARGLTSWGRRNFRKHPDRGLAAMELAQFYCPEGADIAYNLGVAQYRTGSVSQARKTWEELAGDRSWDTVLLCNLGWLCLETGDVDQADHYAMQALAAAPDSPNAMAIRLEVLFARGQYTNAVQMVFANERQTTPWYEERAVAYAVAAGWKSFQTGGGQDALSSMESLAEEFPQAESFSQAATTMKDALEGRPKHLPETAPLPHLRNPGDPIYPPDHGVAFDPLSVDQGPKFRRKEDGAFALVVGLKNYKHMIGPRYAEKDALMFRDLLLSYMGFPNEKRNIRLNLGTEAKSGDLRQNIAWLGRKASENPGALVILYFSGKGMPVYAEDKHTVLDCLIMPYDADPDHPEKGQPISLSEIKEAFSNSGSSNVHIILDAGFYGDGKSVGLGKGVVPAPVTDLFAARASILTAAGVTREAVELPPGEQGAFSYFLLEALMGKGDLNQDGWVDAREAFDWTSREMKEQGVMQIPYAEINNPVKLSKVK